MNAKSTLLAALLALVPAAVASRAPGETAAVAGGKLDQSMQALQNGTQKLGKLLDKKDGAGALVILLDMERAAQDAKIETPPTAAEVKDPAKKAEFVGGFRKQMIELQKALLDMEAALVDDKADDAKKILDERVKTAKKDGHAKYKGG